MVDNMIFNGCNLNQKKNLHDLYWAHYANKSIFNIDKKEIESKLLENEFIADVNVIKLLPNTLIFDIIEISPMGMIKSKNHQIIIDNNENAFKLSSSINVQRFGVPEMVFSNDLDEQKIFDTIEYTFLKHIFSKYPQVYNKIKSIKLSNQQIIVDIKDCLIKFSSHHYLNMKEIKNLSILINNNEINFRNKSYEYIKFTLEGIIIKERESI